MQDAMTRKTQHETAVSPLLIEWRTDGKLWAGRNGSSDVVQVTRCFPWSQPDRYVSLRNDDGDEVALISSLEDINEASRRAVEKALAEAGFVLEIRKLFSIAEDFEIRSWEVLTAQGKRKFQTALDDWPVEVPGGGIIIRDVAGDLFYIDDPDALDEKSQNLLWAYVD